MSDQTELHFSTTEFDPVAVIGSKPKRPFTLCNYDESRRRESRTPQRDEVYLFTDMAVQERQGRRLSSVDFTHC